MTMAASPHVRDPHMRERGFLGYTKGGDSFGLTRGEFVPRPPSLPTPPPSPLPPHGADGAVSRWRRGMGGGVGAADHHSMQRSSRRSQRL